MRRFYEAGRSCDVREFKKLLEDYADLSLEETAELIVEFKRYAADVAAAIRRKK